MESLVHTFTLPHFPSESKLVADICMLPSPVPVLRTESHSRKARHPKLTPEHVCNSLKTPGTSWAENPRES